MTPDSTVRLIADPRRMRVLAAVALGARSLADVARAAEMPHRDVVAAVRRLQEGGLLDGDADGLRPAYERLRQLATVPRNSEQSDPGVRATLRPFIQDGRLVSMPAQQSRRRALLEHVAETSFPAGAAFDEREVDDKLKAWCNGSAVDHVSVRRYLIEAKLLVRANGSYARDAESLPR
ncbi:DUF2087 domain-containing protein [Micromonospora sp. NPDC049275]|uniref:DUF2087 domain-containing protein n=1 Tax=Micromonospora sp. NPDC049275 TaxID=3364268 RepID=UPI0037113B98